MEFVKFQIKMARIKRRDLQRFCIFTWHWGNFGPTLFFLEGFSLGVRFSSSRVILRASHAFVSRHSSLSRRRPVQVLAPHRLVLTYHEPRPSWTSPRPIPLQQSFAAKLGGACAWRSRAGGRNAARVTRVWDDHDLQSLGGLAYMSSLDLMSSYANCKV